jgi:hypothetical protein
LLGIMVVSLASLAWAGVPDLSMSTATSPAHPTGASVWVLPDGHGVRFDEAFAAGGAYTDATITLTLVDTTGAPIFLYPFEDLWLQTSAGGLSYCPGGTVADASTDINGQTTWTTPLNGGGYSIGETVKVYVAGSPLAGGGLNITFNSADINGDLVVNLSDITAFTQILNGNYTLNPKYAGDFNNDNQINLSDAVRMTAGNGTHCI